MAHIDSAKLCAALAGESSALRSELAALAFDAICEQPLGQLVDRALLADAIVQALARGNADRVASRQLLPALERIAIAWSGRPDTLADVLSPEGERQLRAIVQRGRGPRYAWLRGAVDGDDLRQLIAPVVQQLLFQFMARLPIPGFGGAGAGAALGGLVGLLGKQMQRSAGPLADVGRQVFSGVVREFSDTAISDFRVAFGERVKSPEGQRLLARMRDRFLSHVLAVRVDEVARDLGELPHEEVASLIASVVEHQRVQPLFRELLDRELAAALGLLEARPLGELLAEVGLLEATRSQALSALDPALRRLFASAAFEGWVVRLLAAAEAP